MLPFILKCSEIVGGWVSAPDPTEGACSAPPDPLAVMGWDRDLMTPFLVSTNTPLTEILENAGTRWGLDESLGFASS